MKLYNQPVISVTLFVKKKYITNFYNIVQEEKYVDIIKEKKLLFSDIISYHDDNISLTNTLPHNIIKNAFVSTNLPSYS